MFFPSLEPATPAVETQRLKYKQIPDIPGFLGRIQGLEVAPGATEGTFCLLTLGRYSSGMC